jgi:hypothetical protein
VGGGLRTASPAAREGGEVCFTSEEGGHAVHCLQSEDLRPMFPMLGVGPLRR